MLINTNTSGFAAPISKATPKKEAAPTTEQSTDSTEDKFSVSNILKENFSEASVKKHFSGAKIARRVVSGAVTGLIAREVGGGSVAATAGISALVGGVGGALGGGLIGGLIGGVTSDGKDVEKKVASGALKGAVLLGGLGAVGGAAQGAVIASVANALGGGPLAYAASGALMGIVL